MLEMRTRLFLLWSTKVYSRSNPKRDIYSYFANCTLIPYHTTVGLIREMSPIFNLIISTELYLEDMRHLHNN